MPRNWSYLGKLLSFKEKVLVAFLVLVFFGSLIFWAVYSYLSFTYPVPERGGEYIEGVLGQPLYVNPLLSQANESDASLVQLIYSGLLKYDSNGRLVNDLAESYSVSEDHKTYTVKLKQNAKWHDGQPLDARDVIFTVNVIQNPAYRNPFLRQNWLGVEVEQLDQYTVNFKLSTPYFGFIDNLTVGILPKHIWENVEPDKFYLVELNLQPIGSGPYKFAGIQKDADGNIFTYKLKEFPEYFGEKPFIPTVIFNFYLDEDALIAAYNKKEVLGMSRIDPNRISEIKIPKATKINEISLPHYFSVFFNQNRNVSLAFDEVRKALALGVDRNKIIKEVLGGKGSQQDTIFSSQMEEYNPNIAKYDFNLDEANKILDENGWERKEDGIRQKNGARISLQLYTLDTPELNQMAQILAQDWKKIGAEVNINALGVFDLQQNYIRPREYDALIFGQALSNGDPYSFWHSSRKKDPGINLAMFDISEADKLLEDARVELDVEKRKEMYRKIQEIIASEVPAAFIYSPDYLYVLSTRVKGSELKSLNSPANRFGDVNEWYIKTKRIFKK